MYLWYRGKVLGRHGQKAGSSSGPGSGGSCCSTRVGDSGSHCALSQAPWVAWESSTALIYWIGGRKEWILVTDFFFIAILILDCFWGRMCFASKLFCLISSCLGFSWWRWLRLCMCKELVPEGGACLPELAAFIINCVVSHSDRTWFLDDCWYLSSWCQLF